MLGALSGFLLGVMTLGHVSPLPVAWLYGCGVALILCQLWRFFMVIPRHDVNHAHDTFSLRRAWRVVWAALPFLSFFLAFVFGAGYASHQMHQQLAKRQFSPQKITATVRVSDISQATGERVRQVVEYLSPVASHTHDSLPKKWLLTPAYSQRDVVAAQMNTMRPGEIWQVEAQLSPPYGVAARGVFSEQRWLLGMGVSAKAKVVSVKQLSVKQRSGQTTHSAQHKNHVGEGGSHEYERDAEAKPRSQPILSAYTEPSWWTQQRFQLANYRLSLRERIAGLSVGDADVSFQQDKAVLLALLTGDRAMVSAEMKQRYQHMGISHLLAISGPHVLFAASMFAFFLIKLLNIVPQIYRVLPRRHWILPLSLMVAVGYALLAGWDIPAQRTVLMFAISVGLLLWKRQLSFWVVLLLSANVLLLVNPLAVLSAAFWLSFVAVGLLVLLSQSSLLSGVYTEELPISTGQQDTQVSASQPSRLGLVTRFFLLQLVFFVVILPVTLVFFGKVSWLTPLVNVMAIPLLGMVVVPLNILACLLSWVSPTLADGVWWLLVWVLHGFHALLAFLQTSFPTALVGLHLDKTALWSAAVLMGLWLLPIGKWRRRMSIPLILLMIWPRQLPAPAVVTVLDGTSFSAVLVQAKQPGVLQTQKTLLYLSDIDVRHDLYYDINHLLLPALIAQGVSTIDTMVLSYGKSAHGNDGVDNTYEQPFSSSLFTSWKPLHQALPIAHIYTNALRARVTGQRVSDMPSMADIPVSACEAGKRWQWGETRFHMLAPWSGVPITGDDASCVLTVSVVQDAKKNARQNAKQNSTQNAVVNTHTLTSMLLMGNATTLTENMVMALCDTQDSLSADVLLLARQGHQDANQSRWLQRVKPRRAIVAAKQGNFRDLPHLLTRSRLMDAGITLDVTATQGSVSYFLGKQPATDDVGQLDNVRFYRHRWPWLAVK